MRCVPSVYSIGTRPAGLNTYCTHKKNDVAMEDPLPQTQRKADRDVAATTTTKRKKKKKKKKKTEKKAKRAKHSHQRGGTKPPPKIPRELIGKMLWVLERDRMRTIQRLEAQVARLKRENSDLRQEVWELRARPEHHCPGTLHCEDCGECLFCDMDQFLIDNLWCHSNYRCGSCE